MMSISASAVSRLKNRPTAVLIIVVDDVQSTHVGGRSSLVSWSRVLVRSRVASRDGECGTGVPVTELPDALVMPPVTFIIFFKLPQNRPGHFS